MNGTIRPLSPGNRMKQASRPACLRLSTKRFACVVFPHRSTPSKRMNAPLCVCRTSLPTEWSTILICGTAGDGESERAVGANGVGNRIACSWQARRPNKMTVVVKVDRKFVLLLGVARKRSRIFCREIPWT